MAIDGANHGSGLNKRATGSGRRSGGTWSLGRRSPVRVEEQLHRATLVERHSRYVTLAKVANKATQTVVSALIKQAKTLPNERTDPVLILRRRLQVAQRARL